MAYAAGHFAALAPWNRSAAVSRDALAALDRELATAPAGTLAITSVPERLDAVWLWPWASPANVRPPFLHHPPGAVLEHPANYYRVDT